MKVGDLVNNTHARRQSGLGLIVEVEHDPPLRPGECCYKVQWINPPSGCAEYTWNSAAWLEKVK